jgi:hypothetical protein
MTQYIDMPIEGGNRLTVKEAQAVTWLIDVRNNEGAETLGPFRTELLRALRKLELAIEQAPHCDTNKRLARAAIARATT